MGAKLIQLTYQVDATNGQHKSSIPKRRRDTHYSSNGPVVRFAESVVVMNREIATNRTRRNYARIRYTAGR